MAYTIVLDAGHGGANPGATYNGRQEKEDALRLTLAVGRLLENTGANVVYTRTNDIYNSPEQKVRKANAADADYFISIHRNSSVYPNQYTGIESLVYEKSGPAAEIAENINRNLSTLGFADQGVNERKNLIVLNRTEMPAVLVEAGFINNDRDNQIFDDRFEEIAQAIADGILDALP